LSRLRLRPEELVDSEGKIALLMLFHRNPNEIGKPEGLAKRIGINPTEIKKDIEDLVRIGILTESKVYSFSKDRAAQIEKALSHHISRKFSTLEMKEKRNTGIEVLDRLLTEGYASPAMVLISADPGTGATILCAQLACERMGRGESVVYATFDNFPNNVREQVLRMGLNLEYEGRQGKLVFIDCYSNQIGMESPELFSEDPSNLSNMSRTISRSLTDSHDASLILDSLTTLIFKCGERQTLEFLRILSAKTQKAGVDCFIKFNRKAFPPATVASIQDIVDGVIELKVEEEDDNLRRYIRLLKMSGVKHIKSWTPYETEPDRGFIPEAHDENTRAK